jgi:hypothetical protein
MKLFGKKQHQRDEEQFALSGYYASLLLYLADHPDQEIVLRAQEPLLALSPEAEQILRQASAVGYPCLLDKLKRIAQLPLSAGSGDVQVKDTLWIRKKREEDGDYTLSKVLLQLRCGDTEIHLRVLSQETVPRGVVLQEALRYQETA